MSRLNGINLRPQPRPVPLAPLITNVAPAPSATPGKRFALHIEGTFQGERFFFICDLDDAETKAVAAVIAKAYGGER